MKHFLLGLAALTLVGCQDRFRYDCQDPDNWKVEECQKPKCVASGYCTEYLITTEEKVNEAD
jgi:hypothetical protein